MISQTVFTLRFFEPGFYRRQSQVRKQVDCQASPVAKGAANGVNSTAFHALLRDDEFAALPDLPGDQRDRFHRLAEMRYHMLRPVNAKANIRR